MIYWYNSSAQYAPGSNQPFDDAANYADSNNYLNVVVANISGSNWYDFFTGVNGAEGYSTSMGVVVGYQHFYYNGDHPWAVNSSNPTVPSFSTAPFLLAHEIGHHLSLEHLWGDLIGCSGDDGVSDTPKQAEPNDLDDYNQTSQSWNNIVDICGQSGVDGNYENFMDYSYALPSGKGMFTNGQKTKMRHYLLDNETDLIEQIQENDNCSDAINLNTSSSINSPYLKGSVYNATSENFPGDPISCDNGQGSSFSGKGVWYSFVADENVNLVTVKRDPASQILPVMAIYSGSNCNNLTTLIDCDVMNTGATFVDAGANNFLIGERYYVRVYHNDGSPLSVTDSQFEIRVISGGNTTANIIFNDSVIKDGTGGGDGDSDGIAENGEEIDLDIELKNTGQQTLTNISAVLTTTTSGIVIDDDSESFASISPNQEVWSNGDYDFDIPSSFSGSDIDFELDVATDQGNFTVTFSLPVQTTFEPNLIIDEVIVHDGRFEEDGRGDGDNIPESGEEIDLNINIKNVGNITADNVEAYLSTNDSDITITANNVGYADIDANEIKIRSSDFDFDIDNNMSSHTVTFTLSMVADNGSWSEDFDLYIERSSTLDGGVDLKVEDYRVKDGTGGGSGNDDEQINPGESIDLDVKLRNFGYNDARYVKGYLSTIVSPGISITDDYEYFSHIDSGDAEWEDDFDFDVPSNYSENFVIFQLDIESDEGDWIDYFAIPVVYGSNRSSTQSEAKINQEEIVSIGSTELGSKPIVYPNPLLDRSNLHLLINSTSMIEINLVDIQGRVVRKVFSGTKESGKYTFPILDGQTLAAGTYLLQISQNGNTSTIKLVKN
tara:strand:- start:2884 stop:5385 length:2502 start_codon:yes stop_codon:yes gene_type:complete